ncbi:HEAT repeat domain-containing protein, partial [Microcystis viridis]
LEDSNVFVRRYAAEALGKIGSETAIPELLKALEESNSDVRWKAAFALGDISSETAIPGLLKALEHSNSNVRVYAAVALGKIGTEAAMTQLINRLKNPDFVTLNNGDTLFQAREALDTIQNKLKYYHPLPESISYSTQSPTSETSSITYDFRGATIGNLAHNVQGNQQNYPQQTNNNNPEKK